MVPRNAAVAANTNLIPHLSYREHAYMLGKEPTLMEFVIIDTADLFGFKSQENFKSYVDTYLQTGTYKTL